MPRTRPTACTQNSLFGVKTPGAQFLNSNTYIIMAKGNMLLGYSRGKVGSLVFKRQNGEQVTVPRVTPPNPQTHSQMMRRVAFASATKTAKALMGIINHSFQGVQYGSKSVQHFVKMAAKKAFTGVAAADASKLSAAPFQLAPVVPPTAFGLAAGGEYVIAQGDLASANITYKQDCKCPVALTTASTLADFCAALGITIDSQLTLIAGVIQDVDTESDYVMKAVQYRYARINFKADAASTPVMIGTRLNPDVIDLERSSSIVDINSLVGFAEVEPGETGPTYAIFFGEYTDAIYVASIVSRFENGGWRRSNENLHARFGFEHESQPDYQENTAYNDLEATIALYKKLAQVSREEYLNQEQNPT